MVLRFIVHLILRFVIHSVETCVRFATQKDNVFFIDVIAVRNVASVKPPVGGLRGVFAGSLASEAETESRPLQSYVLIC